jgi:Secretion system C-terminal sorting domain
MLCKIKAMKKQLLIGWVLFGAISAFSQNSSKVTQTGLINIRELANINFNTENAASVTNMTNPVKPTSFKTSGGSKSSSTITWQNISASANIYGSVISYCKPLQWNDELNAVSFVHRRSPSYVISPPTIPTASTGGIVAYISTNCGASWDSTAIYANNTLWGRYPGGAIYNPSGNTNMNNAYIVGAGPATNGVVGETWVANWYASKKLGTYDNAPSTVTGAQQAVTVAPPFLPGVPSRHDFTAYCFTATDDGKMRVLAGISNGAGASAADTAFMLMTGTFNTVTSVFDWTGKIFDPPTTTISTSGDENLDPRPIMAWNETGTIGYVVIMGSRIGATGSNVGMQPIVYKTVDSGNNWSPPESAINFNSLAYKPIKDRLWATNANTALVVPNFNWTEGMDCAVDSKNRLHIFTSLLAHPSADLDSLNFVSQWSTDRYLWPHASIVENGPVIHPYLYDFVYDGTNTVSPTWSYMLIDSMSTEGPGSRTADRGYQYNPWDTDPAQSNQKVRLDARLQMSRTPDGKHLLYTWSESDVAFTDDQKKWNQFPNIKARLYDVDSVALSQTEIDLTTDAIGEVASRAMFYFISPKFKLLSKTAGKINVQIPASVSNSNPYAQLTRNTHWYSCAVMSFDQFSTVGISENNRNSVDNSSIYPNPAKNTATLKVNLTNTLPVRVDVINAMGQLVKKAESQGQLGTNNISVDLSGLASGVYFVNVKIDNASSTKKLIIE